jgi:hypothetical protein
MSERWRPIDTAFRRIHKEENREQGGSAPEIVRRHSN